MWWQGWVLRCIGASTIAVLLLVTGAADAQPSRPDDAAAQRAFEAGRQAYQDGRYEDALSDFRSAYELSLRPELLYNVGLAADRLRRDGDAIDAFQRYLDAMPGAANRAEVEARLHALREAQATATRPPESVLVIAPLAPPSREPPVYEQWWLWTLVGIGVVAAVAIPIGVATSHPSDQPPLTGDVGGVVLALRFE